MAERIINLRNPQPDPAPSPSQFLGAGAKRPKKETSPKSWEAGPPDKKHLLQWTALEYPLHERGPYWYLPSSAVALVFIIFGILIRSWFFIAFVALALAVVLLYAKRRPREYRFTVAKEGVYVGGTLHRFAELKSFWIFETAEPTELSLETAKLLHPYLRLPLGEMHPNKVRSALSDFLPEQEHKELFTDQIARSVGF